MQLRKRGTASEASRRGRATHASRPSPRCHPPPIAFPARLQALVRSEDGRAKCRRSGCAAWFRVGDAAEEEGCTHHTAGPVFHEGFKSWGCCPGRRTHDFDEFMAVPGCAVGRHDAGADA